MHSVKFKVPPEQQWLNISSPESLTHQCLFFGINWHRQSGFGRRDVIYQCCMLSVAGCFCCVNTQVRVCFMHAVVFTCAYLFIWSSVLFGYCRAASWSNWADTRLWLILLMSDASRGEDTERKNCQTNIQVTSFIPPHLPITSLPRCTQERIQCPTGSPLITPLSAQAAESVEFMLKEIWEKTVLAVRLHYKCVAGNIHAACKHFAGWDLKCDFLLSPKQSNRRRTRAVVRKLRFYPFIHPFSAWSRAGSCLQTCLLSALFSSSSLGKPRVIPSPLLLV